MEWRYHVVRINDGKEIIRRQTRNREQKKGRPSIRWLDDFESDLMNMGVRIPKTGYVDRTERASVVTEAKAELNLLKPKTSFITFRNSVFCPQCIYMFSVDLRTNSDYFPIQH